MWLERPIRCFTKVRTFQPTTFQKNTRCNTTCTGMAWLSANSTWFHSSIFKSRTSAMRFAINTDCLSLEKGKCAVGPHEDAVNLHCESAVNFSSISRSQHSGLQFQLLNRQRLPRCNTHFTDYTNYFRNDGLVSNNFSSGTALKTVWEPSPNTCD